MLTDIDPFHLFRQSLGLACCVYALLRLIQALRSWLGMGHSGNTMAEWARRYVITQLLRTRFRRFGWDCLQIGFLLALFCYLVGLHS